MATITAISSAEKAFIEGACNANYRIDGRDRDTWRPISIETGILEQANGSSRVRILQTDVIAAVKV